MNTNKNQNENACHSETNGTASDKVMTIHRRDSIKVKFKPENGTPTVPVSVTKNSRKEDCEPSRDTNLSSDHLESH